MLTQADKDQIKKHGLGLEQVEDQLKRFETGFEKVNLLRPCLVGDGIQKLNEAGFESNREKYKQAQKTGRMLKFIPASGAATRMFKELLANLNECERAKNENREPMLSAYAKDFLNQINKFAFFEELNEKLAASGVKNPWDDRFGNAFEILNTLLGEQGLNYAELPKALIPFHKYKNGTRTPLAEHLVEAAHYIVDENRVARLHFTISEKHEQNFLDHLKKNQKQISDQCEFDVSFSCQKPGTDTIAVDHDNQPFRTADDEVVFRPGGHGALIENINDLQADILFIKNVDNVVPDIRKKHDIMWKEVLGGYLLEVEQKVHRFLHLLDQSDLNENQVSEIVDYTESILSVEVPEKIKKSDLKIQRAYLHEKLNRPIRVCGMVKNEGEPGGGPFWVRHAHGEITIEIVEQAQIDVEDNHQKAILMNATHFNPVDLVCSVRDYRGKPFDLTKFIDPDAGFISKKSLEGRELKALELPGLWNGAMSFWNSVFIEVPELIFNPVKTVMDLLRPVHQPAEKPVLKGMA